MKNTNQLQLFLVSNTIPFKRYEDHEAAIYFQLLELIQDAQKDHDDPRALIEGYLGTTYHAGSSDEEIINFLWHTGEMMAALNILKDHWHALDPSLPEDSLIHGSVTKDEATKVFAQMTLRSYLEALVSFSNESWANE